MFVFAILSNPDIPLELTEDRYNQATRREYPYVRTGNDGRPRHFALCPECKNPVQLINRSVNSTESSTLYAKHIKITLSDLAEYNQEAYDDCQYANPHSLDDKRRRKPGLKTSKIKNIYSKYIDLIVSYSESMTGIKFSDSVLEKMISEFCKSRGYEYRAVSEYNLPLSFLYMTEAKSLYGCGVDNYIAESINKSSVGFEAKAFKGGKRFYIKRKIPFSGYELKFFFSGHTIPRGEQERSEYAWLYIVEVMDGILPEQSPVLLKRKITFNTSRFFNDINRRERLHKIIKLNLE
ncbi:hypothetical protein KJE01_19245 [Escherichia marmotae]|uniref:hypothetical protein n=1 Tax=Escherichia TaxID=561 RepID=UPI001583E057|nr:hypothetical protein [Escherichia marmotae]EHL6319335.1 hypothetical protein [Escherichia coli]ELD1722897.1 hypothetical protein [Escherichia coli]ELO2477759.1 hypothetical protein [Escherichia coli]MBB7313486.1 hypothetical protein [Escherichia coli]MDL7165645.1 hypothetical protein [Escherichia coli]